MLVCVVLAFFFLVAFWSPAGKELTSRLSCLFCYATFPNMSWSTLELRVRLAPWNWFKPSSKIFYWPFQGGTSFVDLLCFCSVLCLLCFVRVCLYVLCGHLLGKGWPLGSRLWCLLWVCHFPIGILGQVWYLIVSIPDLCNLITFIFWVPKITVSLIRHFWVWYFFLYFKDISLIYSGIIYYDERSLLLSGSYSGCIYLFHFCVSNIKSFT